MFCVLLETSFMTGNLQSSYEMFKRGNTKRNRPVLMARLMVRISPVSEVQTIEQGPKEFELIASKGK